MAQATLTEQQARPAAPAPPVGRRRRRLSFEHLVMITAGLLAVVLVTAALRDRGATIKVAVTTTDVGAGAPLPTASVRFVGLASDSPLGSHLLGPADFGAGHQYVAVRQLRAGEPISRGDVAGKAAADGLRTMAVAVPAEHAVGGSLAVGDRVDVIDVSGATATYVLRDAQVVAVPSSSRGGALSSLSGGSASYYITLAVDGDAALRLAVAIRQGKLEVVRSTGAAPPQATSYRGPAPATGG